jgi:PAS domain S-box-containing protein
MAEPLEYLDDLVHEPSQTEVPGVALTVAHVARLDGRGDVDHRRASTLVRRALSALELSREATAIAGTDGTFEVVNRPFGTRFGYDRGALLGRHWTAVFTDSEVERLRSTALPTTEGGWRWTGRCDGRRADGETVTVRTAIARLDDGTLAFTVRDGDRS